ncbi:UDP-N-acetylmuramoyl-L-alanyl-D-glutamate--2 6-diaminopimelate ligase, partial [termite gut metagenome]
MELEKLLSAIRPVRITGNREIEITGI